jgi:hypothetical protein
MGGSDGKLVRIVYIPSAWIEREEAIPICAGCGKAYRKNADYPNYRLVEHQADCADTHIPDFW